MAKVYEIFNAVSRCNCGMNDLLNKSDFTDEDIDAITSLEPGGIWTASAGEFSVQRMKDDVAGAYGPRNVWFPKRRQQGRRVCDARANLARAVMIEACEKIISHVEAGIHGEIVGLAQGIKDTLLGQHVNTAKPASEWKFKTGVKYKVNYQTSANDVERILEGEYRSTHPRTLAHTFKVGRLVRYISDRDIKRIEVV